MLRQWGAVPHLLLCQCTRGNAYAHADTHVVLLFNTARGMNVGSGQPYTLNGLMPAPLGGCALPVHPCGVNDYL